MSPIHFELFEPAFTRFWLQLGRSAELTTKLLSMQDLKYVNNDACYPSLIVIGHDHGCTVCPANMTVDHTGHHHDHRPVAAAVLPTISDLSAVHWKKPDMPQIPVISLSTLSGLETNPGFTHDTANADPEGHAGCLVYGDIFMRVLYATRPYEAVPGVHKRTSREMDKRSVSRLCIYRDSPSSDGIY